MNILESHSFVISTTYAFSCLIKWILGDNVVVLISSNTFDHLSITCFPQHICILSLMKWHLRQLVVSVRFCMIPFMYI